MVGTLRPPRAAGPAAGSVPLGLHYPMCAEPMQPNRTQSRRHRPRTRDPPDTDLVTPDPWRDSMVLPRPVEALYGSGCTPWRRSAVLPRPVEGLYGSSATRGGTLRVGLHAVEALCGSSATRGGTLWFFRDPWRHSTGRAARRGGALRFFRDP